MKLTPIRNSKRNIVLALFTLVLTLTAPLGFSQSNDDQTLTRLEQKLDFVKQTANSDPFTADSLAYEVLDTAKQNSYYDLELNTLIVISKIKLVKGRNIRAVRFAKKALDLAQEKGSKRQLAASMLNNALMLREVGSLTKALDFEIEAFKLYREEKDEEGILKALNSISESYSTKGEFEKATPYLFEALEAAKAQGNRLFEGKVLTSLGSLYVFMLEFDKAKEHLSSAEKIFLELDEKRGLARVYNDMGNAGFYSTDTAYAVENYLKAVSINKELGDIKKIILNYSNLTALYGQMGDLKKARWYLEEAQKVVPDSLQTPNEKVYRLNNLAGILTMEGNSKEAIAKLQELMPIARESGLKQVLKEANMNLAHIYEGEGRFEEAYNAFRTYVAYKDSLESEAAKKDIFLAEARFTIEQNELELKNSEQSLKLAEQEKDINELKVAQRNYWIVLISAIALLVIFTIAFFFWKQRLEKARQAAEFDRKKSDLEQRALRASMNPHFIFNALNSIQGLYMEGDFAKADDYLADFGKLLRRTLDNSLKETISIKEEVETLRLYLDLERARSEFLFEYSIDVNEDLLESGIQVPPFIVQPFAENAIWHGILPKNASGHLSIIVTDHDEHLRCEVIDDGVGMNPKPNNEHTSQGIQTTRSRLGSKGSVVQKDNPGGGTIVEINIPKQ